MNAKSIESQKNNYVKIWRKLKTKKERIKTGTYLVEGPHLVEEAMKQDKLVQQLIYTDEKWLSRKWQTKNIRCFHISEEIARFISDTKTDQGIFSVVKMTKTDIGPLPGKKFLLTDAIQDPGNLGTLIRTAEAAGYDAVILGESSVDLYNPKVIRSAQGSHFYIPIFQKELPKWIIRLKEENIPVYGAVLDKEAKLYHTFPELESFALVVGNEGQGISPLIVKHLSEKIYIPIYGKSESLNVGIAAGILMYHLRKKNEK